MTGHKTKIVRNADLSLYGAECECGWTSEYLTDDRGEAENEARGHESEAANG